MVGVSATMLYMVDGAAKTGNSVWNGPIGGTLRTVCFHPKTELKLHDGVVKEMKDISLGDKLENGSKVIGSVSLLNPLGEYFYTVYPMNNKDTPIYVTGSHLIKDKKSGRFIKVENCHYASKTDIKPQILHCLITDDHLIKNWRTHILGL